MKYFLLLCSTIVFLINASAQDASAIAKKLDATLGKVKDKSVHIEMTLINLKSGKKSSKEAELLQKGTSTKLFRYVAPKGDSGIATLSLPTGEIYVYLPMFGKPKKMTNLAESNAFNKSDFSINDMANFGYADNYTAKLLETTASAYRVEFIPKAPKPEYGKLVMDIDKTNYFPVKTDYYNSKMEKVKEANYHHIKVSGIWVADKVSMETIKKKHKTEMTMTNIKLNQGLSDGLFTVEQLKQ
ncbi:MAG: outer membrane lipoprotein-sorting protein [Schleiferiaceae bacterium]|jgi:outer membrane lipoprotein-sorting protein|nr:outer membrane lipoprotein-sorting protein [Schleiferiaceae bacterium]